MTIPSRPSPSRPRLTVLCGAGLLAVLAGCSSGSGGNSGNATTQRSDQVDLAVTAPTGSDVTATATLEAVVLEDAAGTMSGNLLSAPRPLRLTDPTGMPDRVTISGVPEGRYQAVHFTFAPASGTTVAADQSTGSLPLPAVLSATSAGPLTKGSARAVWEVATPGVPSAGWASNCRLRDDRTIPLPGAELEVLAIDRNGRSCDVLWHQGAAPPPLLLRWDDNTTLSDDSGVGSDDLWRNVPPGSFLKSNCDVSPSAQASARRIHVSLPDPSGPEGKVLARLDAINGTRIQVQVLFLERGPLPDFGPLPASATFETAGARIHSDYTPWLPLTLADLQPGNLLEVEILSTQAIAPGVWQAQEVSLEDHNGSGGAGAEVEGAVGAVDVAQGTITIVPRKNDPVVVQGTVVTSAVAQLQGTTLLYFDDPAQTITLSQVSPGQRVWVKGAQVIAAGPVPTITGREIRIRND